MLFKIGNGDIGSFFGEGNGDGAPDAAVATGNNRHFGFQLIAAPISLEAGVGLRNHLRLAAGLLRLVLLGNFSVSIVNGCLAKDSKYIRIVASWIRALHTEDCCDWSNSVLFPRSCGGASFFVARPL